MKDVLEKLHALAMQMEDILSDPIDDPERVLDELKEQIEELTFAIQSEIEKI